MMPTLKIYGVRRFSRYRIDGRCFELFKLATGECKSFPNTKKKLDKLAKEWNEEGTTNAV